MSGEFQAGYLAGLKHGWMEIKAEFEAFKEFRIDWTNGHAKIMHEIKMIKKEMKKHNDM